LVFDEAEHGAPYAQNVAIAEVGDCHRMAVDEGPVGAAVVEHPRAVAALSDDRVAPRDVRILDPDVGRQAATDVDNRTVERDQVNLVVVLD